MAEKEKAAKKNVDNFQLGLELKRLKIEDENKKKSKYIYYYIIFSEK